MQPAILVGKDLEAQTQDVAVHARPSEQRLEEGQHKYADNEPESMGNNFFCKLCCPPCAVLLHQGCADPCAVILALWLECWFTVFCWTPMPYGSAERRAESHQQHSRVVGAQKS